MHGVKGELLTRIRSLVPLAAVRGECSYRFPRYLPVPSAHRTLRAVSRLQLRSPRVGAQSQRAVLTAASVWCAAALSNLRRIFSIEPLIGGAGKEAAYDGRDAAWPIISPTCAEQSAPRMSNEMDEGVAIVRDAATAVAGIRLRKEVSRVKSRDCKWNAGALPLVSGIGNGDR